MLDASVVEPWFSGAEGERERAARDIHSQHVRGLIRAVVPSLLFLEILNVAGRRWHRDADALVALTSGLAEMGFDVADPALANVARWVARGLTAYDAAYVALAEQRGTVVVTDDRTLQRIAGPLARPLRPA